VPRGQRGLKALWNSFDMTMTMSETSPREMLAFQQQWLDYTSAARVDGFATSRIFYLGESLSGVSGAAIQNIFIAVAVSFLILSIITRNLVLPLFATLSIATTILCTIETIFLLGYQFDTYCAILVVLIIGLAVDYAVHLSHFYDISSGSRYERVESAIDGVGISVLGGSVTTCLAGVPLTFAHTLFFQMAGFFLVFVAIYGLFFAFCQLLPLLLICGPTGDVGSVPRLLRSFSTALGCRPTQERAQKQNMEAHNGMMTSGL
jgi:predicted RND superfamily exporter protein